MPDLPEPMAAWAPIPEIQTTDRVLGGPEGPANRQARAIAQRLAYTLNAAEQAAASAAASAATASEAAGQATTAANMASAALEAAGAAQATASSAQSTAAGAASAASSASTAAGNAQTTANSANTTAGTASSTAIAAQNAVAAKATRYDLGGVTIAYSAVLALGAGARSVEAVCTGAHVGDAIFVAPTGAIPVGYAVGAAQCLVADKILVSVIHPALVLGASFSIPLRVFALR